MKAAESWTWLDERLGIADAAALLRKKAVPRHRHTIWYYLGGMTLFLFVVQVATGILLVFYYRPSAEGAYESVQFIMAEVEFGWLIRSLHAWAANLMVFTLFLHFFSVLLLKAYGPPREMTWVTGVLLLGLTLTFGFTGYLLPWNQLAYFATRVGTTIMESVPAVGSELARVLRGGPDVTGATLNRFYAVHVAVLPALTVGLLGLHLYLVQRHGMSTPPSVQRDNPTKPPLPFLPHFLLRDAVGWLAALALLASLAAFSPAHLGEKADPFAPAPAGIRPEWYFMPMFQALKLFPAHVLGIEGELVGIMLFGVVGVVILVIPFLDRRAARGEPSPAFTALGWTLLAFMVLLTIWGYLANPTS